MSGKKEQQVYIYIYICCFSFFAYLSYDVSFFFVVWLSLFFLSVCSIDRLYRVSSFFFLFLNSKDAVEAMRHR